MKGDRAGFNCTFRADDGWKRLVFNLHQFRRILGKRQRLGDHHGQLFTHKPHAPAGQDGARRDQNGGTGATEERHSRLDGPKRVIREVFSAKRADHSRQSRRCLSVDRQDVRMCEI